MKRSRVVAVCILLAPLTACSSAAVRELAEAPTQIVMAHTDDRPGVSRAVYALAYPPGGGEIGSNLAPNGIGPSPPAEQPVAGRIPPAIAANNDTYVVAAWGTYDDVNYRLNLYASENGRSWSSAACPATLVGRDLELGNSPEASRPALTFFPPRRTWFVATRDRTNGGIMLAESDVVGSGTSGTIPHRKMIQKYKQRPHCAQKRT